MISASGLGNNFNEIILCSFAMYIPVSIINISLSLSLYVDVYKNKLFWISNPLIRDDYITESAGRLAISCRSQLPALLPIKIWSNWSQVVPLFKLCPQCLEHWGSDDNDNYRHFVDSISKMWTVWLSYALLDVSRQSDWMLSYILVKTF